MRFDCDICDVDSTRRVAWFLESSLVKFVSIFHRSSFAYLGDGSFAASLLWNELVLCRLWDCQGVKSCRKCDRYCGWDFHYSILRSPVERGNRRKRSCEDLRACSDCCSRESCSEIVANDKKLWPPVNPTQWINTCALEYTSEMYSSCVKTSRIGSFWISSVKLPVHLSNSNGVHSCDKIELKYESWRSMKCSYLDNLFNARWCKNALLWIVTDLVHYRAMAIKNHLILVNPLMAFVHWKLRSINESNFRTWAALTHCQHPTPSRRTSWSHRNPTARTRPWLQRTCNFSSCTSCNNLDCKIGKLDQSEELSTKLEVDGVAGPAASFP